MKKIIAIFLTLLTINAVASDAWTCSNRPWGFEGVLDHIDVRTRLIVLGKSTPTLVQAKKNLEAAKRSVQNVRNAINDQSLNRKEKLKLIPIIVQQKDKQFVVIFDECLTRSDAETICMQYLKNCNESNIMISKNYPLQDLPKQEIVTRTCSARESHPFRYIGNHYLRKFISLF